MVYAVNNSNCSEIPNAWLKLADVPITRTWTFFGTLVGDLANIAEHCCGEARKQIKEQSKFARMRSSTRQFHRLRKKSEAPALGSVS
jgi:hypothetical protein